VVGNRAGIAAAIGSVVAGNVVHSNSYSGIGVACPSLVLGNTATANGINLTLTGQGCTVEHNVVP
jgi:hypothetical protein